MYVRFVVGTDRDNPYWLNGIITAAERLRSQGGLYDYEAELLVETFAWLNANLPCPPFRKKRRSGQWSRNAVCWFRHRAGEPLRRMWDLVAILREHGVPVRFVRAGDPGPIVYEDLYQVVAETPGWA